MNGSLQQHTEVLQSTSAGQSISASLALISFLQPAPRRSVMGPSHCFEAKLKHFNEPHSKRSAWRESQALRKPVRAELDKPAEVLIIPTSSGVHTGWGGSPARS